MLKYWLDGNLLMNHDNVLFRTGQFPTMKFNQFVIAPYIGDGSPVDQTLWIDDLDRRDVKADRDRLEQYHIVSTSKPARTIVGMQPAKGLATSRALR